MTKQTDNPYSVPILLGASIDDVRQWLAALSSAGLLWHMDDDARDIPAYTEKLEPADIARLEIDRRLALAACDLHKTDIFTLYPPINGIEENQA